MMRRLLGVLPMVTSLVVALHGAEPDMLPAGSSSSPSLPGAGQEQRSSKTIVPGLPGTKTEADTFRELLAMDRVERERALAGRTEHQRKYLEGRLREYESMSPEARETRLRQFELRCHLERLTKLSPTNRTQRLAAVPPSLRAEVEERLQEWDRLPPELRNDVLQYDSTATYFLRVRAATPGRDARSDRKEPRTPPGADEVRDESGPLQGFFSLPPKQRQKTLEALPPPEREKMESALEAFAALPLEQRKICVDSFDKFTRMSKEERDQFLKNAARWKAMSARERETWRTLTTILPPTTSASMPPLPGAETAAPTSAMSTLPPVPGK